MSCPTDLNPDPDPGPDLDLDDHRSPHVTALRVDPDGHLTEIAVPRVATAAAMVAHVGAAHRDAVGVETLDEEIAMWFDLNAAEHARSNPAASVIVAMFGRTGPMYGAVVFTGWSHPEPGAPTGAVTAVPVAATLLMASAAASCDRPGADRRGRAAEFADLGIEVLPADHAGDRAPVAPVVSFDALAHTVTVDGDLPCCAECGEYAPAGGHPDHQPEALAAGGRS